MTKNNNVVNMIQEDNLLSTKDTFNPKIRPKLGMLRSERVT